MTESSPDFEQFANDLNSNGEIDLSLIIPGLKDTYHPEVSFYQ